MGRSQLGTVETHSFEVSSQSGKEPGPVSLWDSPPKPSHGRGLRAHQSVGVSNHEESVGRHLKDTDASSGSKLTLHSCPSFPACQEPAARSKLQLTPLWDRLLGCLVLQPPGSLAWMPKLRLKVGKILWNLQPSCLGDGTLRAAQPTPALGVEYQGGKCKGMQKWV